MRAIHLRVFLLCALVTVLDGLDTQSIGLVAPMMAKDLGFSKTQMGLIFSMTQFGATIGALAFGPIADRFGRKPATILAVSIISAFTWATAAVPDLLPLLAIRFIAGIGLAGVMPSVLALTSEYAPARLRGTMVSVVFAGYPAGAALGGLMAAGILANHDWRWVFYIGAIMPLVTLLLIVIWMPESLRFLMSKGGQSARVERLLLDLGLPKDLAKTSSEPTSAVGGGSIWAVFRHGLALPTLLLCLLYMFVFATTKILVVWLPTILTEKNAFTVPDAAMAQASFNLGCVFGMGSAGWLVDRLGPLRSMVPALLLGVVSIVLLAFTGGSFALTLWVAGMIGVFIGIGGSGAHAMASRLYPVEMRSTGLGWGTSASKLGQVISPMLAAIALGGGMSALGLYAGLAVAPLLGAVSAVGFVVVSRRYGSDALPGSSPGRN